MPEKSPIRTPLNVEVKIVDAQKGICDYVASDQTMDCYKEIVLAKGWKFTNFKNNSPFVDSHNYSAIGCLLGKVTDFSVRATSSSSACNGPSMCRSRLTRSSDGK